MTWLSKLMRRLRQEPIYTLPALTALFENHGFRYAGFRRDDSALTGSEEHYFARRDCSFVVEFGIGQHTHGDCSVAVSASHPDGPAKTLHAPLSYFVDYRSALNRLWLSGRAADDALAESVAPHIEYASRVALLAHQRGRSIPLLEDLKDARVGGGGVEP